MASVKDAFATMARNIEDRTGTSVAGWITLARRTGLTRHGEIVTWLKSTHGLTHGYANFLALQAIGSGHVAQSGTDLISGQFSGAKSALLPIYERLVVVVQKFGSDVEIVPKKNNVSIRRHKQFALFQPSTASRLDVGLVLRGVEPTARLESAGSFNAMFTHRVRVSAVNEVDRELTRWLKQAYEAS